MRKIIYYVHTSVDGYIDGPNGEFDWADMGPELSAYSQELVGRTGTFLYGRAVWEVMSSYWPQAESISQHPHDLEFAPIWRAAPKIVVSSTLEQVEWDAQLINTDVAGEIAALKERQGGDLLLTGGSTLMSSLTRLGLVDEWHIVVHPVVLGGGRQLFPHPQDRLALRLTDTRRLDSQAVLTSYVRADG
ncbi:dihydrofolate reductase family protein [Nonomuraea glycinis]|uniref:dihydrofolate reductase family protein n=1 Tax=Nonomuraea glycinis TaxID=2047744 RepID=UPI0033A06E0D